VTLDVETQLRAERLYADYCRAVDDRDLDALAALVHPDVVTTRGSEERHGREAFLDVYREFNAAMAAGRSIHAVSNIVARSAEDGTVQTSAYFQATMLDEHETRFVVGRYHDTHVMHEGRYVIAHKVNEVLGVVHLPSADQSSQG
jgi:uncharacterized protein (TIGR02246 family)